MKLEEFISDQSKVIKRKLVCHLPVGISWWVDKADMHRLGKVPLMYSVQQCCVTHIYIYT